MTRLTEFGTDVLRAVPCRARGVAPAKVGRGLEILDVPRHDYAHAVARTLAPALFRVAMYHQMLGFKIVIIYLDTPQNTRKKIHTNKFEHPAGRGMS